MSYKTLRKVAMILGWKMAKQVTTLTQQQWFDWCNHNASMVDSKYVKYGVVYTFAVKKATLEVFVDNDLPLYQEMTIQKGGLKVDLL